MSPRDERSCFLSSLLAVGLPMTQSRRWLCYTLILSYASGCAGAAYEEKCDAEYEDVSVAATDPLWAGSDRSYADLQDSLDVAWSGSIDYNCDVADCTTLAASESWSGTIALDAVSGDVAVSGPHGQDVSDSCPARVESTATLDLVPDSASFHVNGESSIFVSVGPAEDFVEVEADGIVSVEAGAGLDALADGGTFSAGVQVGGTACGSVDATLASGGTSLVTGTLDSSGCP